MIQLTPKALFDFFPNPLDFIYSEDCNPSGCIKAFISQREAKAYAKSIGLSKFNIVKIKKRFETFYVVGERYTYTEKCCNRSVLYDELSFPTTILLNRERQYLKCKKILKIKE